MQAPCHFPGTARVSPHAKFVKNTARNIAPHQSEIIMICCSQSPRVHQGKSKPNSGAAVKGRKKKAAFNEHEVKERQDSILCLGGIKSAFAVLYPFFSLSI
ncbi:hypothetical protein CDAR_603031 [Caerostris darwini]|uniref:Uncharacterized protein n=1 Tax=Caerostris darwini TaxID=1538125 RepID=A0AAV4N7C6_9ARAC|nr:hypothetical protein CDAR_603031 [Caerostris darwini]